MDADGRRAVQDIVQRQIVTGLDVVNNGEQRRESFVLYLRDRLTGLGGSASRTPMEDIDRYPKFKQQIQSRFANKDAVSVRERLPKAIGPVAYADRAAIAAECKEFRAAIAPHQGEFVEAFLTAPSPGIVAAIVQNEHYDSMERYLAALGAALKIEYDTIVDAGFLLQLDCPDLALERHTSYRDRPLARIYRLRRPRCGCHQYGACRHST